MDVILFWIATTLYAFSAVLYLIHFIFDKNWGERWAVALAAGGMLPHIIAIIMRWIQAGHGPYITRYEVFSSDALVAVAVFLSAAFLYRKIRPVGAIVMSSAFLMMGYGALSLDTKAAAPITFKSWWLVIHILFGKVITGAMLVAGALAIFYLLKSKRPERWPRLPDAVSLDDLSYRFFSLGFCALGLMIVAGSIWANNAWGRYWGWDPIETWSLISWIAFGVILHLRRLHGWRGKSMAWLTVAALFLSIFTAFLITIVSPGIHSSYMVK